MLFLLIIVSLFLPPPVLQYEKSYSENVGAFAILFMRVREIEESDY